MGCYRKSGLNIISIIISIVLAFIVFSVFSTTIFTAIPTLSASGSLATIISAFLFELLIVTFYYILAWVLFQWYIVFVSLHTVQEFVK